MKFSVEKPALSKALSTASRIVERRNTIPILANVAMIVEDKSLQLRSTDLDIELTLSVDADVDVAGVTTVPAQLLNDIVKKLNGDRVNFDLTADNNSISVGAGRSHFKLQTLPESDMPTMTGMQSSHQFTIDASVFGMLIRRVQFAISTEETRYYLNGVFLHSATNTRGEDVLRAVATDGHRLACADIPLPDGAADIGGIIIPRKTVGEIIRLLEGRDTVDISISDTRFQIEVDGLVMTSKIIDGTFPDYTKVIPTSNNIVAIVDTKMMSAATDRVSIVASERGRAVRMGFSNGNLNLLVQNPDSGSAEDDIQVDFEAEEMAIGFNAKYVTDILSNIVGENTRINLSDPGSPTIFREDDNADVTYVLMPMRV